MQGSCLLPSAAHDAKACPDSAMHAAGTRFADIQRACSFSEGLGGEGFGFAGLGLGSHCKGLGALGWSGVYGLGFGV